MVFFPEDLVEKRKQALPPYLKDALYSKEIGQKIIDIAKENGIIEREKIIKISSIVGYIILGLIHPKEIEKYLIEDLQIKESLARDIASALRIEILLDFPELFKEIPREVIEEISEDEIKEAPKQTLEEPEKISRENLEKTPKETLQKTLEKEKKLESIEQTTKENNKQIKIQLKEDPYIEEPLDEDQEIKPVVVREQGRARKIF
ncbi:MAG: hypothetical protein PHO31_00920 [Candidatus Pacebacteria bacterium]|nr:hypothetical protein [Candidatus Paceibacterota bacterium]